MSGYRNYVPWNKSSGPNLNISATTKKDSTVQNKYESSHFNKSKPHQEEEKSATARIAAKYSSLNSSYQPRDISSYTNKSSSSSGSTSVGNKLINEKKESHPPVTYRPLVRSGARSRDPSPVDRSERTSTAYDYNKLYPSRPYTRSVSRERTESTSSTSSTIPKYTGRSSISKEDVVPKYTGRSSTTREDSKYPRRSSINRDDVIPKYSGRTSMERSSNDVSKYVGRTSITKDDTLSRYKVGSRTTSREDLTSNSQKYINSRFLPKNSIEKSLTAYSRPSTARTNEVSRKNRELLNVLHAQQEQERISRPTSRCSSIALDEIPSSRKSYSNDSSSMSSSIDNSSEMETVNVVMRGTSPTLISHTRLRTSDIAKTFEKQITRAKKRGNMIDKEIQSDRLDDTTKSSRFSGASKISATPWSSFLDLKFSSPNMKDKFPNKTENNEVGDSPKSISRNSSSKSLSQSSSKSELKSKDNKKSPSPGPSTKSKVSPPKQQSDKKLPPVIPKSETKANSLHSLTQNKDFRKSVLNMNPDGKNKTKIGRRSNSVSSAESDAADLDATDVSENLSSCKSYHKSNSSSKLPQKVSSQGNSFRERRSPSAECNSTSSTATTSSSEDDTLSKNAKTEQIKSANSSRTSMILTSADELSIEKSSKPPLNPNQKAEHPKNEAEAKSFLMRALAPVTNLFKVKHQDSGEKINWMDNSDSGTDKNKSTSQRDSIFNTKPAKIVISKAESGERAWWLNENSNSPKNNSATSENSKQATLSKPTIRHVESGEAPWWLDENAEIPEGVETYPNYVKEDGTTVDGRVIYKLRKYESDESSWWNSSSKTSTDKSKTNAANIMDEEYLQKHKIRHIDSGERSWWISSSENVPEMVQAKENVRQIKPKYAIRHQDSGEKPWWLNQDTNEENENELENGIPLGDRASPEGLEMPKDDEGRLSPYDNVPIERSRNKKPTNLFISKHTNIDEILGGTTQLWSPIMDRIFGYGESGKEKCTEITADQVVIHEGMGQSKKKENKTISSKLDDAALQLYKDGDYGSYLDLEASISEQQEEFEGFQSNKKNSIVLRTQLSVRVHTIIEKLLTSEGRELRRALFSLKQIFQEDKDLVHEFVQNDGLSCLIKVGSEADQNYQNYILRALGQVMLYVDGMNGVMEHNQTIQWLYSLISSKFRLVVKTALKLLLVFVEYVDSNCMLLIKAIHTVDCSQGLLPYHNMMKLLKDFDSADTELLIYATTLINKILNGVPDQDTYYDQTDALEEQGIENIIQRYMSKPGTDLDLLQQFQIYEAVLQYEDGEEIGTPIRHLDESIRKTLRNRKSVVDSTERRKSRRHSTGTTPIYGGLINRNNNNNLILPSNKEDDDESSSSQSSDINNSQLNGGYKDSNKGNYTNALQQRIVNGNILNRNSSRKDLTPLLNAVNKLDSEESLTKQPWILSMIQNPEDADSETTNENERNLLLQLKRENTVKDLTQKLANQNILHSPSEENKVNRIGDMTGLISKAKEGLAKSKSKGDVMKSPTSENVPKIEVKKSENELRWEELVSNLDRPLNLCDMDFTDLATDDENDVLAPAAVSNGIPPPPPPLNNMSAPPPPPLSNRIPPPAPNPPVFGVNLQKPNTNAKQTETKIPIKKNKKTVKLFWKEVRDDPISTIKLKTGFIWDELSPVSVDTQKLEHLFESRAKDLITKKQQEMNKNKEIIVLDPKRSNAINIGMTKLPPPRSIKTAILKMDATVMNREGIEKLLTMLPTEEERTKIQEAQAANPDLPLGSAEQFLLTLASISELPARLKLWAFKLDFENSEREIAEPLMDLKQGVEVLRVNKTFRGILSTLLSIGNFLNGNEVKGFQIEYLAKVPEVKDTVHKHSLLHHLCHIVMEKFPDATDLYSEIGAITRASKIDFDELALNIQRLEADCKASWDHLKLIAKHDGSTMMKVKMSDFLSDCAERIILLGIIHRRIINRFHKFLLWLGIPLHQISETKPNEFCRIVSEFALEYRTTRERVIQQLEKKANHRERNKTRGKMITDIGKFRTKEDRADAELRQLLGSDISDVESMQGTLPWRRTRRESNRSFLSPANGNLTDGDDEILESLVKTATKAPSRNAPRERKRTRHADRKSLKRSRTRENNPFGSRDSP